MTASEKLAQLFENDKLTDKQLDNLNDWGIHKVSDLRCYLIDKIKELKNEAVSIGYEEAVMALSDLLEYDKDDLLDYDEDEYIVYDIDGVTKLDFDTLNGALDVDQKRRF